MAETIGVEGRGAFYDASAPSATCCRTTSCRSSRCWRWSPRSTPTRSYLQDEKAKVLAAMQPIAATTSCAGSTSATATSRASPRTRPPRRSSPCASRSTRGDGPGCRGTCASARRSRRRPPRPSSSSSSPPRLLFDEAGGRAAGPQPGALPPRQARRRHVHAAGQDARRQPRQPGGRHAVDFAAALGERREAYERLLGDAIDGIPRRFAREDVVEQTWRVVQPALDDPGEVHPYFRGSWGPAEATGLLRRRPLVRHDELICAGADVHVRSLGLAQASPAGWRQTWGSSGSMKPPQRSHTCSSQQASSPLSSRSGCSGTTGLNGPRGRSTSAARAW